MLSPEQKSSASPGGQMGWGWDWRKKTKQKAKFLMLNFKLAGNGSIIVRFPLCKITAFEKMNGS